MVHPRQPRGQRSDPGLRSKYGVNLDTLGLKAQGLVTKRVEAVKERIEKEKALLVRAIKLLEKPP